MTTLKKVLKEYLFLRRSLGFKLERVGSLLNGFVEFLEKEKASYITTKLALKWATQSGDVQPARWATRLGMVRLFAKYRSAADPRTEIPPDGLLPYRYSRKQPYIYTDDEILKLLSAAQGLRSQLGLLSHTMSTLLGLLAVTGMRISEPINLDRKDVDLGQGILTVRQTKFNKSRLVPVHITTRDKLREYDRIRDMICPRPKSPSFFVSEHGTRLKDWTVRRWFVILSHQIGLRSPEDKHGPRLHDMRHRFAISTLLGWYRQGVCAGKNMVALTTYLGHGRIAGTYWYISANPELLRLAALKLEEKKGELTL
ncbi:MAG: tyrosine-type recombinase/integrase [Candidatus Humimicrobiaceae bacterium]